MPFVHLKSIQLPNGETIGYREREGGTEPVLLIHGNMISSKHWDLVLDNIGIRYKVYAIDLRGNGVSTYHTPIQSIQDFSEDIYQFVKLIGIEKFSLIGWSMGGGVGMQFTVDHQELVHKLVLIASISTRGYPFYEADTDGQRILPKRLESWQDISIDTRRTIPLLKAYRERDRNFIRQLFDMTLYTKNQPSDERYETYIDDVLTQRNLVDVYYSNNRFNISEQYNGLVNGTGEAKNITVPTLVLRGTEDTSITKEMVLEIIEDIGENAYFKELLGCGHSPLVDDLDQLLKVISDFLS